MGHYIKERTKNAQFIIISLRNNMFELADRLVGIYKTDNATKTVTITPGGWVGSCLFCLLSVCLAGSLAGWVSNCGAAAVLYVPINGGVTSGGPPQVCSFLAGQVRPCDHVGPQDINQPSSRAETSGEQRNMMTALRLTAFVPGAGAFVVGGKQQAQQQQQEAEQQRQQQQEQQWGVAGPPVLVS